MDKKLKDQLGGRVPLIIGVRDLPEAGQTLFPVIVLLDTVKTEIKLEGLGSINAEAFVMTKEQAAELAARITEALAAGDSGATS
jgi:hypothetical protein